MIHFLYLPDESEEEDYPNPDETYHDLATPIDGTSSQLDDEMMSVYTELKEILPKLIPVLEKEGQLDSFRKFAKSMADGKFPPRNIAYQMFLDVAEWYSTYSTTQMQYKYPDTTKFWTAFYRLFHGKGLRFMSGPKMLLHPATQRMFGN